MLYYSLLLLFIGNGINVAFSMTCIKQKCVQAHIFLSFLVFYQSPSQKNVISPKKLHTCTSKNDPMVQVTNPTRYPRAKSAKKVTVVLLFLLINKYISCILCDCLFYFFGCLLFNQTKVDISSFTALSSEREFFVGQ